MEMKHTQGFSELIDDLLVRLKKAEYNDDLQLVNLLISLMWSLSRDIEQNGTNEQKEELKKQTEEYNVSNALDYWKSISAGASISSLIQGKVDE